MSEELKNEADVAGAESTAANHCNTEAPAPVAENESTPEETQTPEVGDQGGDTVETPSTEAPAPEGEKSDYKVLSGVDFPRNVPHAEGDIIQLTEEEAAGFVAGLIEKVEATEESTPEGETAEDGTSVPQA